MKKFLAGCALAALATSSAYAQETTGTIRGEVTSAGKPVPNATVTVLHVPSGTRAVVVTDRSGSYAATGLRPGGPYTVSVTAPGYTAFEATDINTAVGEPFSLPIGLTSEGPEIVVTASSVKGARVISEGPATVLTADKISQVASINRDIRDLMRRDPFANIDKSNNDGSAGRVSFAGQNSRFNRFTVDGVPISDSFGLNPDALPSRRGPVPIDAIGQFETKVAPYDVREGFFQGGVINATLKSGNNQFHGTGFYSYIDDGMVGKKTKPYLGNATGNIAVAPFKNKDFGATLSGPIIKDKLFFMISGERVRAATPYPFGTIEDNGGTAVTNLTNAQLSQIQNIAQSRYGYNAGGIVRNNGDKDDRLVGRLDANLSSTQRLSLTGIYTKDSQISLTNTGTGTLSLDSNSYIKPNKVQAGIGQLNSDWGGGFSTEVRALYKQYDSGQIPIGTPSAAATICTAPTSDRTNSGATTTALATVCPTNVAQVQIGTGGPSQFNELHVKTWGGSIVGRLSKGDHNIRGLLDIAYTKSFNVFVNPGRGLYYFDSIADFAAGNAQQLTYVNNPQTLNPNDGAAKFAYSTYTFGLQDSWRVNSQLNVTYGVRYDLYGGHSAPALNQNFINRYGFGNDAYINGRGLFQPRFGFDYTPVRRITIRGGAGIFGGGTPDVYVGNSFSNTGVLTSQIIGRVTDGGVYQLNSAANPAAAGLLNGITTLTSLPGTANTLLQANSGLNPLNPNATPTLNALDPHFKLPSQWRATLSASWDADLGVLGDHWRFGLNGLYSKVNNAIAIKDLRSVPIVGVGSTTPDGRQRYQAINPAFATDSNADLELTNTKKGRAYIGVASVSKAWRFGLSANASVTYQNVKDYQAFTSSIANSNYVNSIYYDANGGGYGHSNEEVPWAFKYDISFERAFFRDYKTRFSLFGETRQGWNYSYSFVDTSGARSTTFGTIGSASGGNGRYLFYVPTVGDANVRYADVATQNAVEALLAAHPELAKYRGRVAPRNAFHTPWFTRLDLHVEQEIPTFIGRSRITVWADIENFTNLIKHSWGQQLRAAFPNDKTVVKVTCEAVAGNPCGRYVYSSATSDVARADQLVNSALGASLYAIRVGARFTF